MDIHNLVLTIVILICMGLGVWAVGMLSSVIPVGFVIVLLQVCVVLVAILGICRVWGLL